MHSAPIMTCRVEDNPPNMGYRIAFGDQLGKVIWGWIVRHPYWPENLWHLSACEDGIVHLVGYVTDQTQILPNLEAWHAERTRQRQGNVHEWETDGL